MKNRKVIKNDSIQLTIDFQSVNSDKKHITFCEKTVNNETIVINIDDCKNYLEKKKNKEIINYIISNAKRF